MDTTLSGGTGPTFSNPQLLTDSNCSQIQTAKESSMNRLSSFRSACRGLAAILFVLPCGSALGGPVIGKAVSGNPELQSIQVISFAPAGVLLVGDGAGSRIVAVETGDNTPGEPLSSPIPDFRTRLAGHLGADAGGIELLDLAVNPISNTIYIAARRQADKQYVIATVNGKGQIRELELDAVRYAQIQLSTEQSQVRVVTDVAWADDRIIAAGRSNETFASKIFNISVPLNNDSRSENFSAETYHVSHRRWETKAPMSVIIPFRDNGRTYIVGAFSCTPVVKYPLDSLQPGAQVKGTSVMELGSGNRPIDMFIYRKKGQPYVLANTFRFHHKRKPFGPSPYWTVRFEQSILGAETDINETALRRLKGYEPATERVEMITAFHGVMQMDQIGNDRAAVLRETESGVELTVLPLP